MNIVEIEKQLGKPSEYIVKSEDVSILRKWAILKGNPPLAVYSMKVADLANLYAESAQSPDAKLDAETIKEITSNLFVEIMCAVSVPGFNVDITRAVTREETLNALQSEVIKPLFLDAAKQAFQNLPPKSLRIETPQLTTVIDGPLHQLTETVLRIAMLNHPVMMVGPAGCGKTTIGEHVAKAMQLPFYITNAIQETHQLSGFVDGYGKYNSTPFRQAFEFGGLWVADEIDAWDAGALLAANSALANGYMAFPDRAQPVMRNPNFRMIATANTFGNGADRVYIGRNQLDAASIDRFAMLQVDYDLYLERHFCAGNEAWLNRVWEIRRKVEQKKIRHVVSSRAIAMGAAALRAGLSQEQVEEIYLFKGMSKPDREKVTDNESEAINKNGIRQPLTYI